MRQKSLLSNKMLFYVARQALKIQESMALSLYTQTIPPQEHRSENNLLDCSLYGPHCNNKYEGDV